MAASSPGGASCGTQWGWEVAVGGCCGVDGWPRHVAQGCCVSLLCFFPWCRRHFPCCSKLRYMCTALLPGAELSLSAGTALVGGSGSGCCMLSAMPLASPKDAAGMQLWGRLISLSGRAFCSSPILCRSDQRNPPPQRVSSSDSAHLEKSPH